MIDRIRHTSKALRLAVAASAITVAGVVISVATGAITAPQVLGARISPPAAPKIQAKPANPTNATSATFTYKSDAGATFQCSLDGARFRSCPTSGITYSGLGDGNHTFEVVANVGHSPTSTPATYAWLVDTSAPVVSLTFPRDGVYNSSAWANGCSPTAGICGTAADATSVRLVEVVLLRDGEVIQSGSASGTGTWHLPSPLPADGTYTIVVKATDQLGTTTTAGGGTTASFTIDTAAPPAPVITSAPEHPTFSADATFAFTSSESTATVQCSLDSAAFTPCPGGTITYRRLAPETHSFRVRAVDAAGNASPPASHSWTVAPSTSFNVSGDVAQPFAPGVEHPVNLTLRNPYSFALKVEQVVVTINTATTKNDAPNPACVGTDHLEVVRQFSGSITIPAKGTVDVTSADSRPVIRMRDLDVNQDACKATIFTFSYSGVGVKA